MILVILTFFLPDGNIIFNTAYKVIRNEQGNYIFPSGRSTFKIISGTGIYLHMQGVVIINSDNMERKVEILFKY